MQIQRREWELKQVADESEALQSLIATRTAEVCSLKSMESCMCHRFFRMERYKEAEVCYI